MLRIYKYEGSGHYLGAVVIVKAYRLGEAVQLINEQLKENGLPEVASAKNVVVHLDNNRVIYVDNGDY